jgi:hypothetical protein
MRLTEDAAPRSKAQRGGVEQASQSDSFAQRSEAEHSWRPSDMSGDHQREE